MPDIDTAEYRKLALIAAGVSLQDIPPIIDTATWRKMMIAALLKNTANQAIAGRVDYYGQLPVTTGNPPIGTTYLVLNSSGIYYINYKSAGVYVKLTDTGSLSDWVYAPLSAIGTLPDVTLTNQQVGDTLTWNGTRWVNSDVIKKINNANQPIPSDTERFAGSAQVQSFGTVTSSTQLLDNLVQNVFSSSGACTSRTHSNFYPTDSIYQGGPKWDWTKVHIITFPINLNSGSGINGYIRVGVTGVSYPWIQNFGSPAGWQFLGGDNKRLAGPGFAADFESGTRKIRLGVQEAGPQFNYIESGNDVVGSDSVDFFTMIHSPGKLQIYRTVSRQLLLEINSYFSTYVPSDAFSLRVGAVSFSGTKVMGIPTNPKIRMALVNY